MKSVQIHTDGSCLGNPGPGGWAAVMRYEDEQGQEHRRELSGGYARTTNNRMEILGVVYALDALKEPCCVALYTDSQYVAKAITARWLPNWQRNGWLTSAKKPVKNRDLWERLVPLLAYHDVRFHWLKGHAGNPENERCDELARNQAALPTLPVDEGFEE